MARRAVLAVVGAVAGGFGALGVVRGSDGVLAGGPASANVDSELRFFAAWYAVAGALLLRAAGRPEEHHEVVRACAAGFGLAGLGRLLSWRTHGPPHPVFRVLAVLELALGVGLPRLGHSRTHAPG